MEKYIQIKTRRYSTLIKHIFEKYKHEDIDIFIDSGHYKSEDIPEISKNLCTNHMLKHTIDFSVYKDGEMLFGFHDHPDEFRANISELEFIKKLAAKKIIRYRVVTCKPTLWQFLLYFIHRKVRSKHEVQK